MQQTGILAKSGDTGKEHKEHEDQASRKCQYDDDYVAKQCNMLHHLL